MKDSNGYFYASNTADCLVFNLHAARSRESGAFTNVVLVKRGGEPFKGDWAIPGGFLNENESLAGCAARELEEETGIKAKILIPIGTFSEPGRDPRWPVISSAYAVVIPTVESNPLKLKAGDDASECALFNLSGHIDEESNTVSCKLRNIENGINIVFKVRFQLGPYGIPKATVEYDDDASSCKLAFDHAEILARAILKMPALVSDNKKMASPVAHAEEGEKRAVQLHS